MREIIIRLDTYTEVQNLAILLMKNGFNATRATINYNIRTGIPSKFLRLDQYPLMLQGTLNNAETRVLLAPLTVGYPSPGSYALKKILQAAGFKFEDDDIFSVKRFNSEGKLSITYSRY